jgi:hypothetical protein
VIALNRLIMILSGTGRRCAAPAHHGELGQLPHQNYNIVSKSVTALHILEHLAGFSEDVFHHQVMNSLCAPKSKPG